MNRSVRETLVCVLLSSACALPAVSAASTLKAAANGQFVTADQNNGGNLIANRAVADTWEQFQVVSNSDGTVSLIATINGRYVSADLNLGGQLIANRTVADTWEKFKLVAQSNGTTALLSVANNRYVSADLNLGGQLVANRTVAQQWEQFTISGAVTPPPPPATTTTAAQLNALLGTGINLGNTLDAPTEGAWAAPAQESYFAAYKAAGFTSVRIPVTWDQHFGTSYPYTIDPSFLSRVRQVVGWATSRGLAAVVDAHHESWLKNNYGGQIGRFESLWTQISTAFSDLPPTVAFEILNEPQGSMTDGNVNDMNARILAIIRRTNPTRVVIIGGNNMNSLNKLTDNSLAIPDDPYVIATYHDYNPWSFCGNAQGTWGSTADYNALWGETAAVHTWSASHHDIPIFVGEYGAVRQADGASRLRWYTAMLQAQRSYGFSGAAWEDAGDFGFFYRASGTWDAGVLNAIMGR
jgi:aryl-phospho-beta-D-glucosidase BglC (GH1 family)